MEAQNIKNELTTKIGRASSHSHFQVSFHFFNSIFHLLLHLCCIFYVNQLGVLISSSIYIC